MSKVQLSADLIESFGGTFISPKYDQLCPTPSFHREAWKLYTSDAPSAMVIAPRDHAKSSALSMVYILAEVLFRASDYVILVGSTEDGAAEQLGNITKSKKAIGHNLIIIEFENIGAKFSTARIGLR